MRRSTTPIATNFTGVPHSSHQRYHRPVAAHRHPLCCWLLRTGGSRLGLLVLYLQHPLPSCQRMTACCRRMHDHPQHPLQMLHDAAKRQFAPQAHQRLCACGNRCPSGTCNSLSRGKKPTSTLWAGHIRAFYFYLLASLCLPAASRPSACLEGLTALLAHQSLTDFTAGCRTRLRRLLDRLGHADNSSAHRPLAQSGPASLSDVLLSTAPRRQRLPPPALSSSVATLLPSSWALSS